MKNFYSEKFLPAHLRFIFQFIESNFAAPFFEVELQLDGVGVRLKPGIEEIQSAVNDNRTRGEDARQGEVVDPTSHPREYSSARA